MILSNIGPDAVAFRFMTPKWSFAPTSGAGAATKGGRFNRPGLEALYLSKTVITAAAEYQQLATLLGPGVVATFLVSSLRVVDFSEGFVAGTWEPIWADYTCNWRKLAFDLHVEPPSWVLGDLAIDAGAAGILFPSTTPVGGTNLVLFNSSAMSQHELHVHDPHLDLPHDKSSWPS